MVKKKEAPVARVNMPLAGPNQSIKPDRADAAIRGIIWGTDTFPIQKSPFFASSRKSRNCAEAYLCMSHKRFRRLTPKLRKMAIYGRKLAMR